MINKAILGENVKVNINNKRMLLAIDLSIDDFNNLISYCEEKNTSIEKLLKNNYVKEPKEIILHFLNQSTVKDRLNLCDVWQDLLLYASKFSLCEPQIYKDKANRLGWFIPKDETFEKSYKNIHNILMDRNPIYHLKYDDEDYLASSLYIFTSLSETYFLTVNANKDGILIKKESISIVMTHDGVSFDFLSKNLLEKLAESIKDFNKIASYLIHEENRTVADHSIWETIQTALEDLNNEWKHGLTKTGSKGYLYGFDHVLTNEIAKHIYDDRSSYIKNLNPDFYCKISDSNSYYIFEKENDLALIVHCFIDNYGNRVQIKCYNNGSLKQLTSTLEQLALDRCQFKYLANFCNSQI